MIYKLASNEMPGLLELLSERYNVFVPDSRGRLIKFNQGIIVDWDVVPVWGGLKEFVFPAREMVVGKFYEYEKPVIVVGIRACDIDAVKLTFDRVFFEDEPQDPSYRNRRNNTAVITVDCFSPVETCFCVSVGGHPFCKNGYDINLSIVEDTFLMEVGSDTGASILKDSNLDKAEIKSVKIREDLRDTSIRKVRQNFTFEHDFKKFALDLEKDSRKYFWYEFSKTCIQCGGCNFCCPTCYCSVLNDISGKKSIKKIRQWDSCLFPGYARLSTGDNPREKLWQRFKNKFVCKFHLMLDEFKSLGCTGCGRCVKACPGGIDIREILKKYYD